MRFIDEVNVHVRGGDGGNGIVHWRREKFMPLGGPDGGDGGNGGAVVFVVDEGLNTLVDLAYKPHLHAEHGVPGGENRMNGRNGEDLRQHVPLGTQVYYNDQLVADLSQPNAVWVAARGGRGGRGNAQFTTATKQAPEYAEPGQPGEEFQFRLVLKSVADIALVGFPNVGKSTLISKLSRAQPKIADYPFTTLVPNLGVVEMRDGSRFVIADIPGLIPGAHTGKGLGIRFLKHIERTSAVAFLIDLSMPFPDVEDSPVAKLEHQLSALGHELEMFNEELASRPRLIVLTKQDLADVAASLEEVSSQLSLKELDFIAISSVSGDGLEDLKKRLQSLLG